MSRKWIAPRKWDTITLVGMAQSSQNLVPNIPADHGLFALGVSHDLAVMPREPDVCLEIHPRWMLDHENYSPKLLEWLKQPHPFPIFMAKRNEDMPASVRYPLEYLVETLIKHVQRGDGEVIRYFTSSFDYLIALALAYEPRRLEIVGYDMSSQTEYYYQREGAAFWMGVAAGRGVEVWIPKTCPMLRGRLYAYEGTQAITYDRLNELIEKMRPAMDRCEQEYEQGMAALQAKNTNGVEPSPEARQEYETLGSWRDMWFLWSGARQAAEQLRDDFNLGDIISRQEIEKHRAILQLELTKHMSRLNWYEGIVRDRKQRHLDNVNGELEQAFHRELVEAHEMQNRVRDTYFTHSGGMQFLNHLIKECDLQGAENFAPLLNILMVNMEAGDPMAENSGDDTIVH